MNRRAAVGVASDLVRSLEQVGPDDALMVGRKAARLAELRQSGFPVPAGVVLTVAAFEMAHAGGRAAVMTSPILEAIRSIAHEFGDVPLAVRSSGVAEDAVERSYAGQYDTVLGVTGYDELVAAVGTCWASARSEHLLAYRLEHGDGSGLAVLVQPLVPAEAAGVAFSANPVTGARDEVLVDAVRGLGDRLVAGQVTPDEWLVRGSDVPVRLGGRQDALTAGQVAQVAELTGRVAGQAGCPQDIEWAWAGDEVVLLQARPITALPGAGPEQIRPVLFEVPPGFWLRGGYTLKPLSPMNVSTLIRSVNEVSHELFRYAFGERVQVVSLGGWSYVRVVPLADAEVVRERARLIVTAQRADQPFGIVRDWYEHGLPDLLQRLAAVRAVSLPDLDDPGLLRELSIRVELAHEAQRLHFLVGGVSSMVWGELGVLGRDLLGWPVTGVLSLLTGLPGKSHEPVLALARLARRVRNDPSELEHPGGEFAAAFERYLIDYGQRCLGSDLAEPSMAEQPAMVLRLIADQVGAGTDPLAAGRETASARDRAVASARAQVPPGELERFDRALARAEKAFPLRDDTGFQAHVGWAQVRYAILELSARLVGRGQLATAADIFLLSIEEARAALTDPVGLSDLVARRAAEQAWSRQNLGPLTYGEEPSRPDHREILAELDPADRARLEPMLWIDTVSDLGAVRSAETGEHLLHGTAASPGRYTGIVRVVISEQEFDRLRPGDILVCPETTPQWSVLFGAIGAVVTDTGGLLSHPSILAREHGIPAVVSTGNATEVLRDGQLVVVDGLAGTVEVLDGY